MTNNQYRVQYDRDEGVWKGSRDGASRASAVGNTQKDVADRTRDLARKAGAELSIHRKDNNRIRQKDSYGNDPRSTKG